MRVDAGSVGSTLARFLRQFVQAFAVTPRRLRLGHRVLVFDTDEVEQMADGRGEARLGVGTNCDGAGVTLNSIAACGSQGLPILDSLRPEKFRITVSPSIVVLLKGREVKVYERTKEVYAIHRYWR